MKFDCVIQRLFENILVLSNYMTVKSFVFIFQSGKIFETSTKFNNAIESSRLFRISRGSSTMVSTKLY